MDYNLKNLKVFSMVIRATRYTHGSFLCDNAYMFAFVQPDYAWIDKA